MPYLNDKRRISIPSPHVTKDLFSQGDELGRGAVAGAGEWDGDVGGDGAVLDQDDAVGEGDGCFGVMGDEQGREAALTPEVL